MSTYVPRASRRTASEKQKRNRRTRRIVIGVIVALALLAAGAFAIWQVLQSKVTTVDSTDFIQHNRPGKNLPDPSDPYSGDLNILLIGSDERPEGSTSTTKGMRSDTVMVAHISKDRSRTEIVSIPRDSWVDIPSCQLPNGQSTQPRTTKFNASFSLGGQTGDVGAAVACTITTVETLTGLYIDDYMVIDFEGFKAMVDALGGVEFNVESTINDPGFSNTLIEAGPQTFDGETALRYARVRKAQGMNGSDISRIGRQQELFNAIIKKAKTKVADPGAMYSLVGSGLDMVTTSSRLGNLTTMTGLGWSIKNTDQRFITVPVVDRGDGANVLWTAGADKLWEYLRNDIPVDEEYIKNFDKSSLSTIYVDDTSSEGSSYSTQPEFPSPSASDNTNSYSTPKSPSPQPIVTQQPSVAPRPTLTFKQTFAPTPIAPSFEPALPEPLPTQSEDAPFSAPVEPSSSAGPAVAPTSEAVTTP